MSADILVDERSTSMSYRRGWESCSSLAWSTPPGWQYSIGGSTGPMTSDR